MVYWKKFEAVVRASACLCVGQSRGKEEGFQQRQASMNGELR